MTESLEPATVIWFYLDAGIEPPVALVEEFIACYGKVESLYLIRVMSLKSQAERVSSVARGLATEIRAFLDAGMEPPEALVSEFIAVHVESECLYLEFLQAQDDLAETEEP